MLQHNDANVGRFHNKSSAVIHSDEAIRLIRGRTKVSKKGKKTTLFGIVNFGILIHDICQRARLDDPYADMTLIDIELQIQEGTQIIETLSARIQKILDGSDKQRSGENDSDPHEGIDLHLLESKKPYTLSLNDPRVFSSPYPFMAIRLICLYDYFVRQLKTIREHGLVTKKQYTNMYYHSDQCMRRLFQRPYHYKNCNVNRNDIINGTEAAKNAIQQLGGLPLEIIKGETTNEYGPTPKPTIAH